ncbi:DegT/DnrJ/EryC1/StrS family aminotransferase [Verrucomicrobiota bacterium]
MAFISERFTAWPFFAPDEIEAADRVLRSGKVNYWTGEEGRNFENEFAVKIRRKHAVALTNGTVALELGLRVLGIGPGDEVIVAPRTFVASAGCVVMVGAKPVFADVDPDSQNITAETIAQVLTPQTKAIIPVHLAGWPCAMTAIMTLAKKHGLKVIEDCAQAVGATYQERPAGSFGHVAAFSFCQDKILTTGGEGGMLVADDKTLWEKAWSYKDHGKNFETVHKHQPPPGFRWLHEDFGTNWRMTEMQATIGRVILKKLDKWVERRRNFAAILTEAFSNLPALRVTIPPRDVYHSYYKYYVFLRPERLKPDWNRDRIMIEIDRRGIPCFSGSCGEIYLEKAFVKYNLQPQERLPVARRLGETSLMFLVHPTLEESDILATVATVKNVMTAASA